MNYFCNLEYGHTHTLDVCYTHVCTSLRLGLDDSCWCVPACHSHKTDEWGEMRERKKERKKGMETGGDGNTEYWFARSHLASLYSRRIRVVSIFRDITHETDKSHSVAINHFAEKLGD